MTRITIFTKRDLEILLALVQKVRIFSLRQVALCWWANEIANARRRLKMLAETGFLQQTTVSATPVATAIAACCTVAHAAPPP